MTVKSILIISNEKDPHAIGVQNKLLSMGHRCCIWSFANYPNNQTQSILIGSDGQTFHITSQENQLDSMFDTVWLRRPKAPARINKCHKADLKNATRENITYYQSIWPILFDNSVWVNDVYPAQQAKSKIFQLKIAQEIMSGNDQQLMKIPTTLFSNDARSIRDFMVKYRDDGVIYKTHYPLSWHEVGALKMCYATRVEVDDLPTDTILQSMSGIYQVKIKKKYELRVTVMGSRLYAIRINSQEHPKGLEDWRYIPTNELKLDLVVLPKPIQEQCHKIMKALGLLFGCFDLIVTPEGDYYFLEINEQGQFLWIDDLLPEACLLEQFCQFLIQPKK